MVEGLFQAGGLQQRHQDVKAGTRTYDSMPGGAKVLYSKARAILATLFTGEAQSVVTAQPCTKIC